MYFPIIKIKNNMMNFSNYLNKWQYNKSFPIIEIYNNFNIFSIIYINNIIMTFLII